MITQRTHPRLCAPLALLALLHGLPAGATNSPIELRTALKTLMVWLPGQFDSEPQRFFEEEYKTPKELVHGRVYRSFTRIDAPTLGDNVLVAQVRYGGRDGRFDAAEFQVWTLTVDGEKRAIRMTPQRFKSPANYQDVATYPARFVGLSAADLLPAESAAGCTIWWRLSGKQLRGATEPGVCRTVRAAATARTELFWDWEYVLNDEELWINFAGRDTAGKVVAGRADQTHWRLGKARDFECFLTYRPSGQTEPQVFNGFTMHDRGDVYRLTLKDSRGAVPVFIELIRGMWPSNSGRNYVDLLRMQVREGKTEDTPGSWKLIGNSIGSADTDRVGFSSTTLSSRCKLRQPGLAAR